MLLFIVGVGFFILTGFKAMQGWIKLHRKMISWEWYQKSEMVHLFIHLVLQANHAPKKWQGIEIKRGQLATGRKRLKKETGLSEQTIRSCLSRLKSTNEITIKSTNRFSLITVCNYDSYNLPDESTNHLINQDSNQQSTSNQPATNQQLTTNKNDKNGKNENNDKKQQYSPDSIEYELSFLLFSKLLERHPNHKKPDLQKWSDIVNRMIRLDKGRTPERIREVILWCQQDGGTGGKWAGWQNNIRSTEKLREKFDQLELAMRKEQQNKKNEEGVPCGGR